jgi:Alpha/beta hydrolase domain
MKTRLLLVVLSQSLIAFIPVNAAAQSQPTVVPVPVPKATLVPVTTDSYPLGAADHLNVPEDLSRVGYVEEEYFVSGLANVYEWSPPGPATVRTPNAPYTTRMLVRRPAQRDRLSGNVIVEILNATNLVDLEIGWALSRDYMVRNGDVWIGFTSKPVTALALQKFNPIRYAPLSWANPLPASNPENCTVLPADSSQKTENGLLWDIFSQIAAWARSYDPIQPTDRALRVYGYGYSQSGLDLNTYIGAVLPLAKQENGHSIFDGFLVATSFNNPVPINQCATAPSGAGPAQIKNAGVPIIRIASNSEPVLDVVRAARRLDSDQPEDRFREYEIAGTAHASQSELYSGPNYLDILAAGAPMPPLTAGFGPRSPFHIGIFQSAGFANLDLWVRHNIPPPPGVLINFQNNAPVLDQFGNSTGGVRSPYLDVPTAQWFNASPGTGLAFLIGYFRPFDAQHLQPLYASHEDYVDKVVEDTRKLVLQRYILREDGEEIIRHARNSDVPKLADIPTDLPETLHGPSGEGGERK